VFAGRTSFAVAYIHLFQIQLYCSQAGRSVGITAYSQNFVLVFRQMLTGSRKKMTKKQIADLN
jgi:hypothetical protein